MINISKNTIIIAGITLAIIIGGIIFFLVWPPLEPKESLVIEQDLAPIELTQEEQQALRDEGLEFPSGEDAPAEDLQSVRFSDEIEAIDADINETDLGGLDAELEAIENDLLGL